MSVRMNPVSGYGRTLDGLCHGVPTALSYWSVKQSAVYVGSKQRVYGNLWVT